jgi:hypothetical protein
MLQVRSQHQRAVKEYFLYLLPTDIVFGFTLEKVAGIPFKASHFIKVQAIETAHSCIFLQYTLKYITAIYDFLTHPRPPMFCDKLEDYLS